MIGYSLIEDEVPQKVLPTRGAPSPKHKTRFQIKTEYDIVVIGFVFATILLLLSDLLPKPKATSG